MPEKIVLVRHGRSGHVVKGLIDRAAFMNWREAYEAAGLDGDEVAPEELRVAAERAAVIVSSDARRAEASALLLASEREITVSSLLRELSLEPPMLSRIRMPLFAWALTLMPRWLGRRLATAEEEQRIRDAADWLIDLSSRSGDVIAVTHASFRAELGKELVRRGWESTPPRRRSAHWSAWSFTR